MTAKGKWALAGLVVLTVGGLVAGNVVKRRKRGTPVVMEVVRREDIASKVSATGQVEARRKVDISANMIGKIVNLAVSEGDTIEKEQFLLQIDRAQLAAQTAGSEAALAALIAERHAARAGLEQARSDQERARKNYEREIISAADQQRADIGVEQARASLEAVERRIEQARAALEASRDSLAKTTILAPIAGVITSLPVEEGEVAVIGTMNNPGTKLMTISDMSTIQADLQVDETDVPRVKLGQPATIRIDALPERTFSGSVREIGSSPIPRASSAQAVEFAVKVVFDSPPSEIRPGFSVSAEIETGLRKGVLVIPVQALVVENLAERFAAQEKAEGGATGAPGGEASAAPEDRDVEGVFKVVDSKVLFTRVTTGLEGELKVELTDGLSEGDSIVTGSFRVLRTLKDNDLVRPEDPAGSKGRRP